MPYDVDFDAPPSVGTVITYRGRRAELLAIEPRTRRNGEPGWLLTWMIEGRLATSGLRSESVLWVREKGDA